MTLLEMSVQYADRAAVLRGRITVLRGQARQETDMRTVRALRSRIAALLPLWQEAKELALAVRPETDYEDVLRLLDQTDGARASGWRI